MSLIDFQLIPDPLEIGAYYDRLGNRWIFHSHGEYEAERRAQVIGWLAEDRPLCFL